ncbi:hypothetical protein DPMN_150068 [Dreissena polymorpha]|uniref:Uncharacterized protein n=1 Tax=Dreissena polymorpha TaxID=45954 RepID=A0A9D4FH87_DREPO|nr:hypothetical protein DPMN_150068 [Dreissena polymorpha]
MLYADHRTQDKSICTQMSPKTALNFLHRAQDKRVRPEHDCNNFVGPQEPLLAWFGHVTRHESLCKTVLRGKLR